MKKALIVVGVLVALFAVLVAFLGKPSVGEVVEAKDAAVGCVSREALVRLMGLVDARNTDAVNAELVRPGLCKSLPQSVAMPVEAVDGDYVVLRVGPDSKAWTYWSYVRIKS